VISPTARLGTLSGFAAVLLWSTTFALARSLSERVGAVTGGAAVYLIGGLFCAIRLAASPRPIARLVQLPRRYLFGCGALFVAYTAALYLALGLAQDRQQLLEVALVNYLWPALTILFSLPLLHKRASWWLLPGTLLGLGGLVLVLTPGSGFSLAALREHLAGNPAAPALALFAAVTWALFSNLARKWSAPGSGGAVEWFVPATGLVLLAMRPAVDEPTGWSLAAAVEATALAAISALANVLWDHAVRRGDLVLVAAASYFTPLLSTAASCVYLAVAPAPQLWVGCVLLVVGSLVSWRSVREPAPA